MKKIFSICIITALAILLHTNASAEIIFSAKSDSRNLIALTFDDGPHPGRTPEILDILDKYNIKATFFLVGQNIDYYPQTAKAILDHGHEIGNHTYSHKVLDKCTKSEIEYELNKFNNSLSAISDYKATLMRPPCGSISETLKNTMSVNNTDIILWSIDTKDWAHTDYMTIANNVIENAESGDIILMHDFISGKSPTPESLNIIIPELLKRNFTFVTVSELLK